MVAVGLGTKLVASTALVVLNDPAPPSGIRSIGFAMIAAGDGEQGRGAGEAAGRHGAGARGGRGGSMSVFRIFMGKKLCRQVGVCGLAGRGGETRHPTPDTRHQKIEKDVAVWRMALRGRLEFVVRVRESDICER